MKQDKTHVLYPLYIKEKEENYHVVYTSYMYQYVRCVVYNLSWRRDNTYNVDTVECPVLGKISPADDFPMERYNV